MGIKSVNAGNRAQDIFKKHVEKRRAFVHRLPDPGDLPMIQGQRPKLPPQPADFVVCVGGVMFYAEVKSSANKTTFPFRMIRDSQRAAAKECVRTKCPYFFYVYSAYNDLWYCIPAKFILDRIAKDLKSAPWKDFDKFVINM